MQQKNIDPLREVDQNKEQKFLMQITELLAQQHLITPFEKARLLQRLREDEMA